MDAFTADYLANLTADLSAQVLTAAGRRFRQSLQGTEGEQAVQRALHAGVVTLLAQASAAEPEELDLLDDIFRRFFTDPEAAGELSALLRGRPLDIEELTYLFTEVGFDADTLPGLDLAQGLAAFEAAFLLAAAGEPSLQDTVATGQLLAQTRLQAGMLAVLRELVAFLRQAGNAPIQVAHGRVSLSANAAGEGVIAQGQSVAGGSGSVIVAGSVFGGITVIQNQSATAERPDFARAYCERLRQRCNVLPIAALGGEEETGEEVTLDQVYISLDTTATTPLAEGERRRRPAGTPEGIAREERLLTSLEAVTRSPHVALLGDPGSGKSTFVRQLAAQLAAAYQEGRSLGDGWDKGLLPVLVTLRELAARLAGLELQGLSTAEADQQLVEAVWAQWRHDLKHETRVEDFAAQLERALKEGAAVPIFDGLDEVALSLRPRVRKALQAVSSLYPRTRRLIITCRVRSYTGASVLPGYDAYTLASFDDRKIRDFTHAWYLAQAKLGRVKGDQVDNRTRDFQEAARSNDLQEMASNPLLLTTMAIIHQRDIGLPKERVRLYNEAVKVLIQRWQRHKGVAVPEALQPILADDLKLRQILEMIAYEAQQMQARQGPEARLPRGALLTLLDQRSYLGDTACADLFLDYVDQRAGLLVGYGGDEEGEHPLTYDFAHRSFQEYLAGCRMAGQGTAAREYRQRAAEGDFWYLAALLGAEDLLYNRRLPHLVLNLAYRLCPVAAPESEGDWRALLWSGHTAATVGKDAVLHDDQDRDGSAAYLERLVPRLVQVLEEGLLGSIERADAGKALAHLDDPRPGVGLKNGLPDIVWSDVIAPGPFPMGNDKPEAEYDNEQPRFTCTLIRQPYRVSRYPITVAQYTAFVADNGYQNERYWEAAIAAGRWRAGKVRVYTYTLQGDGFEQWADGPFDYGSPFNLPNHPQVGVSWYEAMACCRWLSEVTGKDIHLPSEAQWERAARHTDGRLYPWGEGDPARRCNMANTGIGATCAVGIFPTGNAVCGPADMSGNVWEWCTTKWTNSYKRYEKEVDDRLQGSDSCVLRGGSFYGNPRYVRCAVRLHNFPDFRNRHFGFRVVLSPAQADQTP